MVMPYVPNLLLWRPLAVLGFSDLHTSSSKSSMMRTVGTACWGGPRHTTVVTEQLQDVREQGDKSPSYQVPTHHTIPVSNVLCEISQ